MITERDPTPAELAKMKKDRWWSCVANALFAVTFMALGLLNMLRRNSVTPYYAYLLAAMGISYVFVFWQSVKRYKELA